VKDHDSYEIPLIRYAIDQRYDASTILALLEANVSPAEARDQNGRSLLERVIESQYSSEFILKVIHVNPEAAKIDFEWANLQVPVLFHALQCECSGKVILAVLHAYPVAAKCEVLVNGSQE
jgi:hypothetical protein